MVNYSLSLTRLHLLDTCRAETAGSSKHHEDTRHQPFRFIERVDFHDGSHANPFQNQLRHTIPLLHYESLRRTRNAFEIRICEVEEHDSERTTIVAVDHSSAHVNELLQSQSGPRCYPSDKPFRKYRRVRSNSSEWRRRGLWERAPSGEQAPRCPQH